MYKNKKQFLLIITFPLMVGFMCEAMDAPQQPIPQPAPQQNPEPNPTSYDDQVRFAANRPKGEKKETLRKFLFNTHAQRQKKEEELNKLLEQNDTLRRDIEGLATSSKAKGEKYAEDIATARQKYEQDIKDVRQALDKDNAAAQKAFADLKSKFDAEVKNLQTEYNTLKANPPFSGPVTYKNLPPAAADALKSKYDAQAALAWRQYYFDGVAYTADKILLPAIAQEVKTYTTYKRQQWWKTPAELQMEEYEGRKSDHQEVLIMSGELDLEIKRRTLEEMEINKRSKAAIEDATLQNTNLNNALTYAKQFDADPAVCNQLKEMAGEIQLAQYREAYKKRFGREYVAPKANPTNQKK